MHKKLGFTTKSIWTFLTCWIISGFNGGFVTFLPYSNWLPVFFIWFIYSCYLNKSFLNEFIKNGWTLVVFVGLVMLSSIYLPSIINVTTRSFFGVLVAFAIYCFLMTKNITWSKPIIKFYFFEYICQLIYAIYMLRINPVLIRKLLTSTADSSYPFMMSFAGVYITMAIMIYFLVALGKFNIKGKLFFGTVILAQFILILMCNLATPLIIGVTFLVGASIFKDRKKFIILSVVMLLSFGFLKPHIGEFIVSTSNYNGWSITISQKLYELGMNLKGITVTNENATYAVRQSLNSQSLQSFYDHFLFGVYGMGYSTSTSGHDTWRDILGNFGILRSSFFLLFIMNWGNKIFKQSTDKIDRNARFYSILVIFTAGFFNPIIKLGIAIFIISIMPFCNKVIIESGFFRKGEKKQNENNNINHE